MFVSPRLLQVFLLLTLLILPAAPMFGQATIATGSIEGTVTDPQGAVLSGAKITVSNQATGQRLTFNTTSSGGFSTGALPPGDYVVRAENKGFQTMQVPVTVRVGVVSPTIIQMKVGSEGTVVNVESAAVNVNT